MAHHHPTTTAGLSTMEATAKLYDAIKLELDNHQLQGTKRQEGWCWVLHHGRTSSMFRWTTLLYSGAVVVGLLLAASLQAYSRPGALVAEAVLLLALTAANLALVLREAQLRTQEMATRARTLLLNSFQELGDREWQPEEYPKLHQPQSPCIQLQWTQRDGRLVNLPQSLLVAGDVIVMRPGHPAPAACRMMVPQSSSIPSQKVETLSAGEIFSPPSIKSSDNFTSARFRTPTRPARFLLLETPYIQFLRDCLDKSLNRPDTAFNKEQHTVMFSIMERVLVPLLVGVVLGVGVVHSISVLPRPLVVEYLVLRPCLVLLALLSPAFPLWWLVLSAVGTARLLCSLHSSPGPPGTHRLNHIKKGYMFSELEEEAEGALNPNVAKPLYWGPLLRTSWSLLRGTEGHLWRSANLLHTLGSLSTFCCVDKKGILSWPNPTPEKVFFLKALSTPGEDKPSDQMDQVKKSPRLPSGARSPKHISGDVPRNNMFTSNSQVEVLDLTHSTSSAFGVQFDDANWSSYINNLKPLGLGILLNTCNPEAQDNYSNFCDHIACESLYNDAAVPVVNKRCLCELATQIGFTDKAVGTYRFQQQVGLFRHVRPEVIQKGRLARSLNIPRLKMPFPNMTAAIIKDVMNGTHQIFSQGTADLVLDACSEYWNGRDIRSLSESDRKKILDFYQRSSLTAHCMAFSYGPLISPVDRHLTQGYLELPPDSSHIFPSLRSLNSIRSWDWLSSTSDHHHHHSRVPHRHLSSESLLQQLGSTPEQGTVDVDGALRLLGHEVFIGMVTMQYQACPDIVCLVEQLDNACIRFVHFSKENELRSRVFSEKMGLESGWNCHISLLSEKVVPESEPSIHQVATLSTSPAAHCKASSSQVLTTLVPSHVLKPRRSLSAPLLTLGTGSGTVAVKFEEEISMLSPSEEASDSSLTDVPGSLSKSPSRVTDSTEHSAAPLAFDMSNRAKLPKGIRAIRPHLVSVDNVPLLVSLFTDCTPDTTREMVAIMQEHGRVVCCMGSSANPANGPVFLQADASIALEPLYPQLCKQQPMFRHTKGPTELSRRLNSLPCCLSLHREDHFSFFSLIAEGRQQVAGMRSGLEFLLSGATSVAVGVGASSACLLPLPLAPGHVAWLVLVTLPLLAASLATPLSNSRRIMEGPTAPCLPTSQNLFYFLGCFCLKFIPSICIALFCFILASANFCPLSRSYVPPACQIFVDVGDNLPGDTMGPGLTLSQHLFALILTFYFVVISSNFVHRDALVWAHNPFSNRIWSLAAVLVLVLQLLLSGLELLALSTPLEHLSQLPYYLWLLAALWPLVLIPINELVKRHEIKVEVRHQKRARLEFGTKLGMNSPF